MFNGVFAQQIKMYRLLRYSNIEFIDRIDYKAKDRSLCINRKILQPHSIVTRLRKHRFKKSVVFL